MSENGISLTKTQKARVKWLKNLGLRMGIDFEIGGDGLFLYLLDEYVPWESFASKEYRDMIAELAEGNGQAFEYDAETRAALAQELEPAGHLHIGKDVVDMRAPSLEELERQANEDHILGLLNDHIGSHDGDGSVMEEVVVAQLEAMIEPMIEALAHKEVVMEPSIAQEEPIFVVTTTGVVLSKGFRKQIAEKTREFFTQADEGEDIPALLQRMCIEAWGESQRTFRAAFAVKLYAQAVMRSLQAQVRQGNKLSVNQHWA
jgi:hypothetical protein